MLHGELNFKHLHADIGMSPYPPVYNLAREATPGNPLRVASLGLIAYTLATQNNPTTSLSERPHITYNPEYAQNFADELTQPITSPDYRRSTQLPERVDSWLATRLGVRSGTLYPTIIHKVSKTALDQSIISHRGTSSSPRIEQEYCRIRSIPELSTFVTTYFGLDRVTPASNQPTVSQEPIQPMELLKPLYNWSAVDKTVHLEPNERSTQPMVFVDEHDKPLNPYGPPVKARQNERPLRHEGPNTTSDIMLLRKCVSGIWQALAIVRKKTGELALPGGFRDETDATPLATALRELQEETNIELPFNPDEVQRRAQTIFEGPTLSPRATDHSWIETHVSALQLNHDEGDLRGTAQDDAKAVGWFDLSTLASGRVANTPVRRSHTLYFKHAVSQLQQ